jgi:hypothetical protein
MVETDTQQLGSREVLAIACLAVPSRFVHFTANAERPIS